VERACGTFQRTLSLPYHVEPEEITATFKDGILKITVPKPAEPQAQEQDQKIAINRSGEACCSGPSSSATCRPSRWRMWDLLSTAVWDWPRHYDARARGRARLLFGVPAWSAVALVTAVAGVFFGEEAVRGPLTEQFQAPSGPAGRSGTRAHAQGRPFLDFGWLPSSASPFSSSPRSTSWSSLRTL
jgi:Hsp20/alpha crystallin family